MSLCKSSKSTAEEVVRKFLEFRPFKGGRDELDGPEAFVRLMRLELLGREGPGPSSWGKEFIEILKQLRSDELTEDAETIAMASRRIDFKRLGRRDPGFAEAISNAHIQAHADHHPQPR